MSKTDFSSSAAGGPPAAFMNPLAAPSFVFNDAARGEKVFWTLQEELRSCRSFWFSVAFISQSGIQLLKPVFQELKEKGIPGRILTTDYLCFSDPKALDFLADFPNIELRMHRCEEGAGFHTKGYCFEHEDGFRMVLGSSNLTGAALTVNEEWNARLFFQGNEELISDLNRRFEQIFSSRNSVLYSEYRPYYKREWKQALEYKSRLETKRFSPFHYGLKPNLMQLEFIENLEKMIAAHEKRALLISATGTGKTYAAAFAVEKLAPSRILFLVHREQLARQALESFQKVIPDQHTYGLIGGGRLELEGEYLFSTVQTFSKESVFHQFQPDDFDLIIIDEVHRAAAQSYQKLFSYFDPKFLLGMSATPQRSDQHNIYEMFDHNVALHISLQTALEQKLLCPFHYYALSGLSVGDESYADPSQFSRLISEERIRHILEQTRYYGFCGDRVQGLIFAASVREAEALSQKLNEHGLRTTALSAKDSSEVRKQAIERLRQKENDQHALDYLITVDLFNEGVDIPEVNQIVLLRPTQSSIIFTQQIGRGLRRHPGKEYVVILDFIGQYASSYMIPAALSGSADGNKDQLRRFVIDGTRSLPGQSTVYFDRIARTRIFKAIDRVRLNSYEILREKWQSLHQELGRIPSLMDFALHPGTLDPLQIFYNKSYSSYPRFLEKVVSAKERALLPVWSEEEHEFLSFISIQWADGKRLAEIWMLEAMSQDPDHWEQRFEAILEQKNLILSPRTRICLLHQMSRQWLSGTGKHAFSRAVFLRQNPCTKTWEVTEAFRRVCRSSAFQKAFRDVMDLAKWRFSKFYQGRPKDGWLILNERYTYLETFRMMDLPAAEIPNNVGGYKHFASLHLFPVYVNYEKAKTVSETTAYEDTFLSPSRLKVMSKSRRTLESSEIQVLRNWKENGLIIPLFVRKNTEDERREFYYLGTVHPSGSFEQTRMADGKTSVVCIEYELDHPVSPELYEYLTFPKEVLETESEKDEK